MNFNAKDSREFAKERKDHLFALVLEEEPAIYKHNFRISALSSGVCG